MSNTDTNPVTENIAWSLRPILIAAGIVVVGGAIYAAITTSKAHKESDARNALFRAEKSLDEEMKPFVPKEAEKAAAKDEEDEDAPDKKDTKKANTKKAAADKKAEKKQPNPDYILFNVQDKLPKSVASFQEVYSQYAGTRAGYEAAIQLGDLYLEHGNSAQAVEWYEKAGKAAPQTFDEVLSLSSLATAFENIGKLNEAKSTLEKAIQKGEVALKPDLMLSLARVQEELKDIPGAKKTYDDVQSQFPKTQSAHTAEERKGAL